MLSPHPIARINLEAITARNEIARHMVAGFASEVPALAHFWQNLQTALADTLTLTIEITRLSAELATDRHDTANLLAAIKATIAAYVDGETDPLWYVRDELNARQTHSQDHGRPS